MAKRAANDSFVDLTLDSDDDAPVMPAPAKKSTVASGSPKKPVVVCEGTPASMRSRQIQEKLRRLGVSEREIKGCVEKSDLVKLLERTQQCAGVVSSHRGAANPVLSTPPTVASQRSATHRSTGAKLEGGSASAADLSSMRSNFAAASSSKPVASPALSARGKANAAAVAAQDRLNSAALANLSAQRLAAQDRLNSAALANLSAQRQRDASAALALSASRQRAMQSARMVGRGRNQRCSRCYLKATRCLCHLLGRASAAANGGLPSGMDGSARNSELPSRVDEEQDLEVGLSHKDADEQTFTEYVPHTFSADVFKQHPDPVVETASLSSLVPPKTTHKLRLCAKTITDGLLTNLQVNLCPEIVAALSRVRSDRGQLTV